MKIIGQYDSEGNLVEYKEPIKVSRFGNWLVDDDGCRWAILDDYNDWVSATMHSIGIKSRMVVDEE